MTAQKHLKQLIRARMEKTGERYAAARRSLLGEFQTDKSDPLSRWHFPGDIPATTALRILLTHHGVRAPHTGEPFSEAMLFGIAGGVGIGVFSFYYEKDDFASFFIAGRHQWHDDEAYLKEAIARFGLQSVVKESGGVKAATLQLREALDQSGPCIVWVDMAGLPHRAMPALYSGGGYTRHHSTSTKPLVSSTRRTVKNGRLAKHSEPFEPSSKRRESKGSASRSESIRLS